MMKSFSIWGPSSGRLDFLFYQEIFQALYKLFCLKFTGSPVLCSMIHIKCYSLSFYIFSLNTYQYKYFLFFIDFERIGHQIGSVLVTV